MLEFGELSGLEQLETEFDGLDVVVEGAVVHQVQKVDSEVLNPELEPDDRRQRRHPMPHNVPRHFLQLHNRRVKVNVQERRESLA